MFTPQPSYSSWPGWGDDFKGQIVSNGKAIVGASIGADFGCCTESDSSGIFTIGLREGKTRIYILPSGNEQTLSAGTYFTVTMVGKTATSVINEAGLEVPIIDGLRQFSFAAPNISGSITTTSIYSDLTRYSYLSSPKGQTDVMMNRGRIQNNFAYKVLDSGDYFPYFEFRGSRQLFAIGPSCSYSGSPVTCPVFNIKEPNFVLRIVGSSGNPVSKTSVSVRPLWPVMSPNGLFVVSLNGLSAWQNTDLSFSYFLADGIYLVEPPLNDSNNLRKSWEVKIQNGKTASVVEVRSNTEVLATNGIYDLDYLTSPAKVNFAIKLIQTMQGGAVFKVEPIPKIQIWTSVTNWGKSDSTESLMSSESSKDGLITLKGLKGGDEIKVIFRSSSERLAISEPIVVEKTPEEKAKSEAEDKAKAEAVAKARAECKKRELEASNLRDKIIKAMVTFPEFSKRFAELLEGPQLRSECIYAETLSFFNSAFEMIMNEAKAKAEAEAKAKAEVEAKAKAEAANKKVTITCVKGKTVKKVTSVNPKCPSGYKKK